MDKWKTRCECLQYLDLDILGVAETHLTGRETLDVPGYVWFGHNRQDIHVNAVGGSGDVGCLVRAVLFDCYDISVDEQSYEGILWIRFKDKARGPDIYVSAISRLSIPLDM